MALIGVLAAGCGATDPVVEARRLLRENEVGAAVELLQGVIEERRTDPDVQHLYGLALLRNQQPGLATWPLRRAAQDPAHAVESGMLLTRALLTTGNGHAAIETADAVLAAAPDHLGALRLRANARVIARQEDEALEDLDRLIASFPDDLSLHEQKLGLLRELERFDEAEQLLAEVRRSAEARDDLGEEFLATLCAREAGLQNLKGDAEAARLRIESCLERHSDSEPVLDQAISYYDATEDEERAAELVRGAAAKRPGSIEWQVRWAHRVYQESGDEEAHRVLLEAAERIDTPLAWMAMRDYYVGRDLFEPALEANDRVLTAIAGVAPGHPEFDYAKVPEPRLFEAAVVNALAGRYDRAEEIRSHLEEEAFSLLAKARIQYERGDLRDAVATWDRAFRLYPSNAAARYLAGIAYLRLDNVEKAIGQLRDSIRADAAATDAGVVLAQVHTALGDPGAALEPLAYHLKAHPRDSDALRMQARLAARAGNVPLMQHSRAVLGSELNRMGEAVADQARDLAFAFGAERSLRYLDSEVTIELDDPANAEALAAWAERMLELGRTAKALARVEANARAHPDSAALQALHGALLRAAGRDDEARQAAERAVEIDPEQVQALIVLAGLHQHEGDVDLAVSLYERAAAADDSDPTPLYAAADALLAAGRADEGRERLERLLEEKPWEGRAAHALASQWFERGDHGARTLALAERAARFVGSAGPRAYETLGSVLIARGDPDAAVAALRRGASLGAGGPSGLYRVGHALSEAGDAEGAIRAFKAALSAEDFPEEDAAREALARLEPVSESAAPEG